MSIRRNPIRTVVASVLATGIALRIAAVGLLGPNFIDYTCFVDAAGALLRHEDPFQLGNLRWVSWNVAPLVYPGLLPLFAPSLLSAISLIYLFGKLHIPETMRKALHYVPPAVLSAIIFPELFLKDGRMNLALDNYRLLAGLFAMLVAWFSKNTLVTIVAGMIALFLLQIFF